MNVGILPGFPQYGVDQGVLPGLPASRASHDDVVRGIAGLRQWYAADKIPGVTHGAGVALWPDSSGNGFDVVQATSGNQPVFQTNVFNDQPALLFDGTNTYLENTALNPFASGAARTVIAVVSTTHATNNVYLSFRLTAPLWLYQAYFDPSYQGIFWGDATSGGSNTVAGAVLAARGPGATILTVRAPGAGGQQQLRVNGKNATVTAGSTENSDTGTTGIYVGRREGTIQRFTGHIGEIITYTGALSDADCLLVEKSLMRKYFDLR